MTIIIDQGMTLFLQFFFVNEVIAREKLFIIYILNNDRIVVIVIDNNCIEEQSRPSDNILVPSPP